LFYLFIFFFAKPAFKDRIRFMFVQAHAFKNFLYRRLQTFFGSCGVFAIDAARTSVFGIAVYKTGFVRLFFSALRLSFSQSTRFSLNGNFSMPTA